MGLILPRYDIEMIHKMRTTVKKMRALSDWSDIEVKKIFRKYYRIAGSIRNVQLLIIKIRRGDAGIPFSFIEWLEGHLHHLKIVWQETYRQKKIKKEYYKLKKVLKSRKRTQHALRFALDKNEQIIAFRNARPLNDERIHNGRKIIKEIDYLNKWENKPSDDAIKKLADTTGNYMDAVSDIQLLELYIEQEIDQAKRNAANSLLSEWIQNKDTDMKKLLKSIDTLSA
ncbi:MAG TPA: hypothetical protein VM101_03725 [Flavitalea sp.]|nr:hypothetical protein [Flavitalea sp.]